MRKAADAGEQHGKQRHVLPAVVDHGEQISKYLHLHRVEIAPAGLRVGGHAASRQRLGHRLRLRPRAEQYGKVAIAIASRFARLRVGIGLALHDLVDAFRDQPRLDLQIRRVLQRVLLVLALGALFADQVQLRAARRLIGSADQARAHIVVDIPRALAHHRLKHLVDTGEHLARGAEVLGEVDPSAGIAGEIGQLLQE